MQQDPEKVAKRRTEKKERSAVLKEKIIKMIESGLQLSEYQARKAFTVYLQCILQVEQKNNHRMFFFTLTPIFQRLSDFDDESGDPSQIDLVLKFLQKVIDIDGDDSDYHRGDQLDQFYLVCSIRR